VPAIVDHDPEDGGEPLSVFESGAILTYLPDKHRSLIPQDWTAFSNLLSPIAEDICPMPEFYRQLGATCSAYLDQPLPQMLIDHRDRILRNDFILPIRR
jgi:glutathione S-transferase